jgi:hypothetical protein
MEVGKSQISNGKRFGKLGNPSGKLIINLEHDMGNWEIPMGN